MDDIARAAGVHRSTVSLALRNQPRIPLATRERIAAIARSLGYVPDPMLDAFNFHRMAGTPPRGGAVIAFVSDLPGRDAFLKSSRHLSAYEGARARADKLGFKIDLLFSDSDSRHGPRLGRVLQARNITCVIAGILDHATSQIPLEWSRYCLIALESFQLNPPMDSLAADHRAAARLQFRRLREAGHERIGFITTKSEDLRLQSQPLSGYLLEQFHERLPEIPALIAELEALSGALPRWVKKFRPTALVAGCLPTLVAARDSSLPAIKNLVWCGPAAGAIETTHDILLQQYHAMGARAVEFLALRQQTNQRGLPVSRTSIVLPLETSGRV